MQSVLSLQMLPAASFMNACEQSDVSCNSEVSCSSDQSCISDTSHALL